MFNECFKNGKIPSDCGKGIINPIPKSSTTDPRDPLSYRGITLAPSTYKLYCSILSRRLTTWAECLGKISDEQNGFRKGTSTIDQLSALTNIIETRQKKKLSTYCAFIDFKKAYDLIDRNVLWNRLRNIGVNGRLFEALKAIYSSVQSCVRLNNSLSDWFDVNCGLRQGCSLSPILFNLFVDDFALSVKALGKGLDIGNEGLSILLYAYDIVLLADNELDLQCMLDHLNNWCNLNHMFVNADKSQIVHFRARSTSRTLFSFSCGSKKLAVTDKYVYLGLTLTVFLDYNTTAKMEAQSASRALDLLIAKCKSLGGMPYDVYSKLYESLVWLVIAYDTSIWGDRSYSCIDTVQNRAMKFFLGVGKYTPTVALVGDMGWNTPFTKQWKCISYLWSRLRCMNNDRIKKRIFNYCLSNNNSTCRCKNWPWRVIRLLNEYGCQRFVNVQEPICKSKMTEEVTKNIMSNFRNEWSNNLNRDQSARSQGGNKLRNYKQLKLNSIAK